MTVTRQDIARLTAAVFVALAATVAVSNHGLVRGASVTRAWSLASTSVASHLRLMSNGKIAYVSSSFVRDPLRDLVVINPNGTGRVRLAHCATRDCVFADFTWSPDGKRLAFVMGSDFSAVRGYDLPLYVVNADGSGKKLLAGCGQSLACGWDLRAALAWSPDGSRLVFSRGEPLGLEALYIVNVDTGKHRLLTQCTLRQLKETRLCIDESPAWSPDGSKIAFEVNGGLLYIVNVDGSGLKSLRTAGLGAEYPAWSPNGKRIAFTAVNGIYAVNANGSNLRRLVSDVAVGTAFGPGGLGGPMPSRIPAWSPDGTHILIGSFPALPFHRGAMVWVMDANGTHLRRLYRAPSHTIQWAGPIWSPDGKSTAFSVRSTQPGLYLMAPDGRHLHRVTRIFLPPDLTVFPPPAWQPIP
jgi:Tol biopolymer transport system component